MKNQSIWVAVNKNKFVVMFIERPKRNNYTGKWEGKYYCNSIAYSQLKDLVEHAELTWQHDPEPFNLQFE